MGHKVNPISFRLGLSQTWRSKWFTRKKSDYAKLVCEDAKIRRYIKKELYSASISKIEIERSSDKTKIVLHTARPGVIIGRKGSEIDRLRNNLQEMLSRDINIDIKEIKKSACDAQLIAENIAFQLEKRVPFRRAMKRAIQQGIEAGLKGIKIVCQGRLGGGEMSRRESYKEGKIPLQTIKADIDYGFAEAFTTYGLIGVKVWIYKGEYEKPNKLTQHTKTITGGQDAINAQEG